MTGETVTWEIPYATDTDRLCDGYAIVQAMAERVDAILDDFDATLATSQVRPLARVSTSVTQETTDGSPSFETVDFDTANLATQAAYGVVTILADQYHVNGSNAYFQVVGASAGNTSDMRRKAGFSDLNGVWLQREPGTVSYNQAVSAGLDQAVFVDEGMSLQLAILTVTNVFDARMWILKIGDV